MNGAALEVTHTVAEHAFTRACLFISVSSETPSGYFCASFSSGSLSNRVEAAVNPLTLFTNLVRSIKCKAIRGDDDVIRLMQFLYLIKRYHIDLLKSYL